MGKRAVWVFVAYVVFLAWLDWITHRSVVFVIVVGGGLVAAVVYRSRLGRVIMATDWARPVVETWDRASPRVRRLITSMAPLLYVLVRGQGTSNAGVPVVVAGLAVAVAVIFFGNRIDARLMTYYAARDRLLPRGVRMLLAPALAIVIAFLVVHGSLADIPALFGGQTSSPQSPIGLSGAIFLATLLAGVCTVLLLREGNRST
jgi:hypothetical protein